MFWEGKRVLITGHTGFKGAWLSLWLQHKGANVTGYALAPPTVPSLFDLASGANGMHSLVGDVRDFSAVRSAFTASKPEIVIHLAAQALVRTSYFDPIATYNTNVMGTVNMLEAVRQVGDVSVVLVVTSDKCYDNREWVWGYRETDPMGGYDPYSSSKGCAELITSAFRSSFFSKTKDANRVAVASARAGNVIGGGDWAQERLVPDVMRAFLKREAVKIRNPHAVRPWQHVLEPLNGYMLLVEKLFSQDNRYQEAWNFGPLERDTRPVSWIVDKSAQIWGEGASFVLDSDCEQPHEAGLLKLDSSKARGRLKWEPRLSLEQGLEQTVQWYKAFGRGEDMREVTLAQIQSYEGQIYRENSLTVGLPY
ncbi:MAG: CDP-glucose 4,6-dehydratase [Acidobacteriales bacterium]|nr:CDP-glucose 4,6-dehydratase [Terriglobales bacterium]